MKTICLSLFVSLIFLVSCEKTDPDSIIGNWNSIEITDNIYIAKRVKRLDEPEYGFSFKEGSVFLERKIDGWCGTPPVVYADYTGTWSKTDSLVVINVGYWGGRMIYRWTIISVDETQLLYTIDSIRTLPDYSLLQ